MFLKNAVSVLIAPWIFLKYFACATENLSSMLRMIESRLSARLPFCVPAECVGFTYEGPPEQG